MKTPGTYTQFLQEAQQYEVSDLGDFMTGCGQVATLLNQLSPVVTSLMPGMYVLDYTKRKFLHVNQSMSDMVQYPQAHILGGGTDFAASVILPEDLAVYNVEIFKSNLRFLQGIPPARHADFLFSCNYRIRARRGEVRNIRQQSVFLHAAPTGLPLAAIGFLTDITDYAPDRRISHTITPLSQGAGARPVVEQVYFTAERDQVLSKREVEVLQWICEGLTSSQIAERMNRSINTINSHRCHILEKTSSKNLIDLVRYAIRQNYL